MTSVGTGYDLSNSVFSPDGRNFQVEYAGKAVENGSTTVGLKFKDGVVFAVEKTITNKLLVPGRNRKIQTIDRHVGCCYSGLIPDGKHLVNRGREEASSFKKTYGKNIPLYALSERLSQYVQAYTLYNSVRPFGIAAIFGGVLKSENGGDDKPQLYMLEPNGSCFGYKGIASGKGRQTARSEIEKLISADDFDIENFTAKEAVKQAARIIYLAHEDNKDKDFELELSWCSLSETDGLHKFVPKELYDEAVNYAKEETGLGEDDDSEDNDEDMD